MSTFTPLATPRLFFARGAVTGAFAAHSTVMTTLPSPQITLTRMSANGFKIEANRHRSTLAYAVRDSVRTATLGLGVLDAAVSLISHGVVAVAVQTPLLRAAELDGLLQLTARKWAQINGYRLADVERIMMGA